MRRIPAEIMRATGDTQPLVRVGRGELTCLRCGETFAAVSAVADGTRAQCWRCGSSAGVPTISYLDEGEYEIV